MSLHKPALWLARTRSAVGVKDLDISGVVKDRHLAHFGEDEDQDVGPGIPGFQP
jgi:hypothetical protein